MELDSVGIFIRSGRVTRRVLTTATICVALMMHASPSLAQDEVRFGASLSLTGSRATEGRLVKDGYDFMVKHINERGGIPIGGKNHQVAITYYDDESDADTGVRLVEKMIVEDDIKFLLGPYSSTVTLPASSVAEKYQIPMVEAHGAATPIFERGYKYIFATLNTIDQYFGNILEMASSLEPRPQTIALINENTLAPQVAVDSAAELAGSLGIEVVYQEAYPSGTQDLSSELAAIREANPDILLAAGYTGDMILLAKQANEMGVDPTLFGFMLGPTLPGFKEALGDDSNFLLEPIQWSSNMGWTDDVFGWTPAEYATMFEEEFGYEPDYHPPQSSAALMVYYHALEEVGELDPKKVRDAIARTDIETFYGPIKFDESGKNVGKGMAVVQIQDLTPTVVYPAEFAESELVYPRPGE